MRKYCIGECRLSIQPTKSGSQAENCCAVNITITTKTHKRRKTTNQHRTIDTRSLYRETNEGNEGDTGGATVTMIG